MVLQRKIISDWIPVKLDSSQPIRNEGQDNLKITILVSPFDVPVALRGVKDESTNHFTIEFRYLDDYPEPIKTDKSNSAIILGFGKYSGRLFKIDLDIGSIKAKSIDIQVPDLNHLVETTLQAKSKEHLKQFPQGDLNFIFAQKALEAQQKQLFSAIH